MERMIRCIEGHVFDADKHGKCPECGWAPKKLARKDKRADGSGVSLGQLLGSMFDTLTAGIDRLLKYIGVKAGRHVSAGIVYAAMILLCVTAVAYPGSPLWPGRWGKNSSVDASTGVGMKPLENSSPNTGPNNNTKRNQESVLPPGKGTLPKSGTQQYVIPNKPIEVGGENTTGFGAIAYSPTSRFWGESFGWGSQRSAERRAMKECSSDAENCQVGVSFYGQCGAIADDANGVWGAGLGRTPQEAVRDAMETCTSNNGKNCELQRVTCTH
jgi:hypothetical protein